MKWKMQKSKKEIGDLIEFGWRQKHEGG